MAPLLHLAIEALLKDPDLVATPRTSRSERARDELERARRGGTPSSLLPLVAELAEALQAEGDVRRSLEAFELVGAILREEPAQLPSAAVDAVLERWRYIATREQGPKHPSVALALAAKAEFRQRQGRWREAELLCTQALELSREAHGPSTAETVCLLELLARCLLAQERDGEAKVVLNEARLIREVMLER